MKTLYQTNNRLSGVRKLALGVATVSAAGLALWATTGQAFGGVAPTTQTASPQSRDPQVAVAGQTGTDVRSPLTVAAARVVTKTALREGKGQDTIAEGLVNREGNRFYVGTLPIVQGNTAALQLAVENRSEQKLLARVEVAGPPSSITVNVVPIPGQGEMKVVRLGATSFMVEIKGGLAGMSPNLEVQWTPGLGTVPASYPVQVTIQAVEG